MPAVIDEHTQFVDSDGKPIVNGFLYIGVQGADPKTSPQTIYSDRALTSTLSNPQVLDANGRSTNKIWVAGAYSIRASDSADVQKYQNLDAGETSAVVPIILTSVAGSNTITATDALGASAYVDQQLYLFRTALANTGSVTININGIGAVDVVKNQDQSLLPREFEADQNVILVYNSTTGDMEWVNHNTKTVHFYNAANVASASTTDIWAGDGNSMIVTGTTTITSFGTSPNVGAERWLTFSGALTLTHSANLSLPGSANYTTAADDIVRVYAKSTTQFDVTIFKKDGTPIAERGPIVGTTLVQNPYAAGATVTQAHGLGAEPDEVQVVLECLTAELGFSIGDRVLLSSSSFDSATSTSSFQIEIDATNVVLRTVVTNTAKIVRKSDNNVSNITAANWKLEATPLLYRSG